MAQEFNFSKPSSTPHSHTFPLKLHQLLDNMEEHCGTNIVSWMREGTAFKIHDKEKFTEKVMPLFCGSNKLKSFQRNLNLWGFTTDKGPGKRGISYHKYFRRGQPELCLSMKRIKVKGNGAQRRNRDELSLDEKESNNRDSSKVAINKNEDRVISSIHLVESTRRGISQKGCVESSFLPPGSTMRRRDTHSPSAIIQALRRPVLSEKPEPGSLQDEVFYAAAPNPACFSPPAMGLCSSSNPTPNSSLLSTATPTYMPSARTYLSHLLLPAFLEELTRGRKSACQEYNLAMECARNEARAGLLLQSTMSLLTQALERRRLLLSAISNNGTH